MRIRNGLIALFLLGGALASACTFQPGLSNAPSINRQRQPTNGHDAISNGPESCSDGDAGSAPFPGRAPPCNPQGQMPMAH